MLLTSSGHEWQFYTASNIYPPGMTILHWDYISTGDVFGSHFTLLLTSSGQEGGNFTFQFLNNQVVVRQSVSALLLMSSGQEWQPPTHCPKTSTGQE